MILKSVLLENFRSHSSTSLPFSPGVNIILGSNGAGKTNALEAIYMLQGIGSFKPAKRAELVRWGESEARLFGELFCRDRDFSLSLSIFSNLSPSCMVNGVKRPVSKGLGEVLKCVVFTPEDLYLIFGSPALRRDFLDKGIARLRPGYNEILGKYNKLLEGKNRILRNWDNQPAFHGILPDYTEKMAALSCQIIKYRFNFVKTLLPTAQSVMWEISHGNENLTLSYKTISAVTNCEDSLENIHSTILNHFKSLENAEIRAKTTLSGIHKDDLLIDINGKSAKSFASQGQTRSTALALKLSEHSLFARELGEPPILLLDDVFSELDSRRRDFIMEKIGSSQVIVTSCYDEKDRFPKGANIISLA